MKSFFLASYCCFADVHRFILVLPSFESLFYLPHLIFCNNKRNGRKKLLVFPRLSDETESDTQSKGIVCIGVMVICALINGDMCTSYVILTLCNLSFQYKVKPELHYGEEDCPVSAADGFPKDADLHFEIELIDFCKVKAGVINFLVVAKIRSKFY